MPRRRCLVRELLKTSYQELLQADYKESLLTKALPLITQAREELLMCGTWYVAEHPETKQVVGCGGWTKTPPTSKDTNIAEDVPHMRHFACDPGWTRCGIASALWKRSLADMASLYEKLPNLEVFSTLTATPFYKSLGFTEVKRVELPLDNGTCMFPAVLMRREGDN